MSNTTTFDEAAENARKRLAKLEAEKQAILKDDPTYVKHNPDAPYEVANTDSRAALAYAIETLYLARKALGGYALSEEEKRIVEDKWGWEKRLSLARMGLIALDNDEYYKGFE